MSNNHYDWFKKFKKSAEHAAFEKNPVAYFSAEYALDSALPTYAGGLGVLAGDFIRETAKQGFPLISVGLFYKKAQSVLSLQEKSYEDKLKIVKDTKGQDVVIELPIENRLVKAQAWQWSEGEAKVYLLDTDIAVNTAEDREITKQLYAENRDLRLKQEIMLGIGGFRLLARLGYHASVYHLNEGHSALLGLELVRHEMEHQHTDFKNACEYAKKHIVFTNHTLVPAGQEQFASDKVGAFIDKCAKEICLSSEEIIGLGAIENDPSLFSMTNISFRLTEKSNTVSKLHSEKAKTIWPKEKMENVTNGIFIERWDKIKDISKNNIWELHLQNKKRLLALVKEKTGEVWSEHDLILGWSRRLVEYKQPLLFLEDTERLLATMKSSPIPIRIVFSGPTNEKESLFVTKIKELIEKKLKGIAVFIPNYNTEVAEVLTAGADVWLNTPIEGTEACGTSGMKAGLNGGLALSTNDGWIHEVSPEEVGWVVNRSRSAQEMHDLLQNSILPLYTEHLQNPKNSTWVKKMEYARNLILENFSTTRMLREYIEKLYIPALKQKHEHKAE